MDSPKKICSQCGATKDFTRANFGVNTASPDGYRNICKECYSDNRYGDKTKAVQALRVHDKKVAKAQRELKDNLANLSPGQIEKYDRIVRLAPEHRAELQKKILGARQAEEAARIATSANPVLEQIRARFPYTRVSLALDDSLTIDVATYVADMRAALEQLTDEPAHTLARRYLAAVIEGFVGTPQEEKWAAERQTTMAEAEQEAIDERACQEAADAIHDKFKGLFGQGVATHHLTALKTQFQIYRAEAQKQAKAVKPDDRTATGASCKLIAQRILTELTAIASRLGKAGTENGPQQSLENVESFDWQQQNNARSVRAYVRQLTAQLEEARANMTPEEYEKKYLQLPSAPKEEIVVWRARLLDGTEEWLWSSGKKVRRGVDVGHAEVIKDAIYGWCFAPSPIGAAMDDDKPAGIKELVQEDNGKFVWKVVDANERWEQGNDGHWSKVSGNDSPWTAPEPVTFKLAPAQPDALHSEFRTGSWWTKAECDAVDKAPMLDEPPIVLPPLTRTRADCVATEPPMTAEQIARENRQPNRWKRHEEREKFRKEQEAAMLRGTFKWDVSEYQQK